jgi:predicted phosphodiesterase
MPKFQIPPCTTKRGGGKTLVVTLGDFHYGAKICVRGLMGEVINEYDHKIFECRMTDLFHEIVNILEKEEIDHITLFLVGDLLDGMLRQSQLMRLEFGVIESTMRLSEYLSAWVNELSEHAEIDVYAVTGNHSEVRPLKSKCREFEDENLEKVIMWFMEERLSNNPHVSVNFQCNKFLYTEVQGFSFLLLHGDGERAVSQISKDTINMYSKKIDFFVCGHKHREEEISSGMTSDGNSIIIRTPSLCGVDSYAQSKGYCGKPGAIATVIERGYGRRCVYPIIL